MQLARSAGGGVLMARSEPSFLWFTRGGRAYVVTDPAALDRVGALHPAEPSEPSRRPAEDPRGGAAAEANLGEQLRDLAEELLALGAARPAD